MAVAAVCGRCGEATNPHKTQGEQSHSGLVVGVLVFLVKVFVLAA